MKRIILGLKALIIASLFLMLVPLLVLAQSAGSGALTGTVTDSTGALVPNVTVTVTGQNGQARTATTGGDGSYKLSLLPPGDYRVKFEATGFQSVEVSAVTVSVTETGTLNRQLVVGAQTQQVTVEANVETIQTASSTLGTVIGSQTVTDLPLNTRNFTNLIALSAGANASVNNATLMGKGFQSIATNGAGTAQNNFQMDGVTIVNYLGNGNTQELGNFGGIEIPPPDSIQEFKIQTSSYDASYGRSAGANVNVVTKSGTNAFHGTAFEFFRNTSLNANDFFLKRTEFSQGLANKEGTLNQNQYGGVFGGPIKKDKLFFFVSYQETWQKNGLADSAGSSNGVTLPPLGLANDRGDCSGATSSTNLSNCNAAGQAFVRLLANNVGTGAACPQANTNTNNIAESSGSLFTGSTGLIQVNCIGAAGDINTTNINPVAIRLLQLKLPSGGPNPGSYYVPTGTTASSTSNAYAGPLSFTFPAYYKEHQGMGNWDYVINGKHTLSGRYFYGSDPSVSNFANAVTTGPFLLGPAVSSQFGNQGATLKLTSVLSGNLVNEARITYQRNTVLQNVDSVYKASDVGMTAIQAAKLPQLPLLQIGGAFNFGTHNFALVGERANEFFAADQVSWTRGKQTIRTGFEVEHESYTYRQTGFGIGALNFSRFADFLIGLPGGCGSPVAGVCNGSTVSNIQSLGTGSDRVLQPQLIHAFYSHAADGFVQDDIKVSQRLTINLGLRWEYNPLIEDQNGMATGFWFSLLNTQPFPGSGCVYNTVTYGTGAGGCSFAGYVMPANYNASLLGPLPSGVLLNNNNYVPHRDTPWDNFGPRVGFAWQPFTSSRFVVRGGAGYFYDRLNGANLTSGITHNPPYAAVLVQAAAANAASSLAQPFATTPPGFVPRWVNFANGTGQNINFGGSGPIAQNFVTPLTYQYNMNIQYEFLSKWVLELGYVGSHGIHQVLAVNPNGGVLANAANPTNCGFDGVPTHCVYGTTSSGSLGTTGLPGTTTGGPVIRAPYLGLANAFGFQTSSGSFKFNSLQVTVRKQFSHGFQFQSAYTFSRAFALTQVGNPNASFTDNVPVVLQYGPNTVYRPHRLVINYTWNLPSGRHHDGPMGKLLDGWSVSGVTTIQDGAPLTITDSRVGTVFGTPITGLAQFASGMGVANIATSGGLTQRLGNTVGGVAQLGSGYLNPAAFCAPTNTAGNPCLAVTPQPAGAGLGFGYGNSHLGAILGPGQFNWDMSLAKTTRIGGLREDATLQFRAEFFNAFNHAQFANPSVTFNSGNTFGFITQASVNPRLVQLALKYSF